LNPSDKNFKVFAEYFTESNGYAIYSEDVESFDPLVGYQVEEKGQAFVAGARYDF
jgi:hypothetical protein